MGRAVSDREIVATIREYENSVAMPGSERITYLDTRGGIHLKQGDDAARRYSMYAARCSEYLRFGYEVDAVTCGEFNRTSTLKLCDTPAILQEAGFDDLPMLYTQRHLLDALRPKDYYDPRCHGLAVEQVKRIPELLERPVLMCDSPAREDVLLSVLCAVDSDRLPLIAAIKPGGSGYYEMGEIQTNFVLAVYGRSNFPQYLAMLMSQERLVYYNEERGRALNALAKLQLLRSHVVDPDLSDIIIHTPRCLVNMETAAQGGCDLDMESREARDACGSLTQGRDGYDRFREADAR